eukprot:scaffold319298_cov43-Attheya_sp.AAC.1
MFWEFPPPFVPPNAILPRPKNSWSRNASAGKTNNTCNDPLPVAVIPQMAVAVVVEMVAPHVGEVVVLPEVVVEVEEPLVDLPKGKMQHGSITHTTVFLFYYASPHTNSEPLLRIPIPLHIEVPSEKMQHRNKSIHFQKNTRHVSTLRILASFKCGYRN